MPTGTQVAIIGGGPAGLLLSHILNRNGIDSIVLERQSRSNTASALRRFLGTPEAMHLMRSPAAGVPPSRFRPPVYVTIWS